MIDHEVCELSEISIRTLRAWARVVALAADLSSREELVHGIEHFQLVKNASGAPNLVGIDATCNDMLHRELAHRDGAQL